MREKIKRPAAIIIIICISLLVGIGINFVWNLFDKSLYPKKYSEFVEKYSAEYNVPEEIIYATIKTESGFDPEAVSSAGAKGLMQMMPSTFEWLTSDEHLGEHLTSNLLFDPEVSIRYGTYYLKYLHTKFDQNWDTAFAAYNGGEGNVTKWLSDIRYSDGNGNITSFPRDFDETKNYVRKVNKYKNMYYILYYKNN